MTLVDLPGLAKLPVGDQPPDVERRVRDLAMRYVSAPTCLILAVTPAGADAVTSDALHLAREADPRGERTLGVLTKCDLADGGRAGAATVSPLLRGEVLPLRLGYVAVMCRGGRASASGASAADGRAAEAAFFASERGAELVSDDVGGGTCLPSKSSYSSSKDSKASSLLSSRCGIPALAAKLNRVLTDAVRGALPDLRAALEEALAERSAELAALGGVAGVGSDPSSCSIEDLVGGIGSLLSSAAGTSSAAATAAASLSRDDASPAATAARGGLLLQLLESYSSAFAGALDGSYPALPLTQLASGARIRHVFRDVFVRALDALDPCSELSDDDVRTAVKNAGGVRGTLLIPDAPFELLAKRAIARLLSPALQCKELAVAELLRLADECTPPDVRRFPALRAALLSAVEDFVSDGALPAERMIRDLVACELAFINMDHPDFVGGSRAVAMAMERRQQLSQESAEKASAPATATHPQPPPAAPPATRQTNGNSFAGAPALRNHHHLTTAGLASALKSPSVVGPSKAGRGAKGNGSSSRAAADDDDSSAAAGTPPPPPASSSSPSIFASETVWNLSSTVAASSPAALAASTGGSSASGNGNGGGGGWRFVGGWLGGGSRSTCRAATPAAAASSPSPVPASSSYYEQRQSYYYGSGNTSLPIPPATLTVADASCFASAVSEAEEVQVEVTRTLVRCYFSIVARGLADAVPKAVMHFLVRSAARGLQQHLIQRLYREELFAELVAEAPGVARRREAARAAVAAAREGLAALDALPAALAAASRAGCGRGSGGGGGSGSLRSSRDEMLISAGAGRKAATTTTTLSSSSCLKGGSSVRHQQQQNSSSSSNVIPATSRVGALAAAARLATAALGERGV